MRLASVRTALGSLTSVAKSLKDGDRQLGLKEEIVENNGSRKAGIWGLQPKFPAASPGANLGLDLSVGSLLFVSIFLLFFCYRSRIGN